METPSRSHEEDFTSLVEHFGKDITHEPQSSSESTEGTHSPIPNSVPKRVSNPPDATMNPEFAGPPSSLWTRLLSAKAALQRLVDFRLGIGAAISVLLLLAVLSLQSVRQAEESSNWVEHTLEIRLQLEELVNLYSRTRGLWRNYLAQGNQDDKISHEVWAEAIPPQIRRLDRDISDNPPQRARLRQLEQLLMGDLASMREGIALKASGQLNDPGQSLEQISRLQMAPVEIRAVTREMQATEQSLLSSRRAQAREHAQLTATLVIAGGGTSLIVLLLAFRQLLRENAQRKAAECAIAMLNSDLAERAAELQSQRQELQDYLDSMTTLTLKIGTNGDILMANKTAQRFGFSTGATGSQQFVDCPWSKRDVEASQRATAALAQTFAGIRVNYEETIHLSDELRDISVNLVPVYGSDGKVSYVVAEGNDITALKQAKRALDDHSARLEMANKELESFSYSVSHDLRAPLRAIDGYSRMLEEDYANTLDAEGKRLLGVIRDNSRGMGQLIDDLLAFSRMGRKALSMAMIDMKGQAAETAARLIADEGITNVQLEIGDLHPAMGDSPMIRQVWANLLSNAIKFSAGRERPVIQISSRETEKETIYSVKDNGTGFDMRYANKLFGVFQRLHSAAEYPGTGVGLAIVQRIVVRHGGSVGAEGEEDRGACFWFSLPKPSEQGEKHDGI